MPEVLRILHQEHVNMAKLLKVLERQLATFDESGEADYEIMQGVLDYCLTYPDLYHHPKEDLVYRKLREHHGAMADALGDLQSEHEDLGALTRRFAAAVHQVTQDLEVPRGWIDRLARNFLDRYWRHMRMEEEHVFPAALRLLTAEDWAEIDAQVRGVEDPIFGEAGEERFARLRREILAWDALEREASA